MTRTEGLDAGYSTIVEPFRIHSVEPIDFPTRQERHDALDRAHYNLFGLKATWSSRERRPVTL